MKPLIKYVETVLFGSRWLLTIFYFGLILGLLCYAWVYITEIFHLMQDVNSLTKEIVMLIVLELVDMVMIANLVKMIITGSYNSSVSQSHGYSNEDMSSGILKIKMATSMMGVTSVHLLQSFINNKNINWDEIYKMLVIHGVIVASALSLAVIEYLHDKGDAINPHDSGGIRKQ